MLPRPNNYVGWTRGIISLQMDRLSAREVRFQTNSCQFPFLPENYKTPWAQHCTQGPNKKTVYKKRWPKATFQKTAQSIQLQYKHPATIQASNYKTRAQCIRGGPYIQENGPIYQIPYQFP